MKAIRQTKRSNKPLQSPKTYHQLHVPSHATGSDSYYTNPTFRNSKITQPIAHNHQRNIKKIDDQHKDQEVKKKKNNLGIIVFPDPASNLMTPQIESLKLDLPNAQFLRSGVLGRLMLN
ncbi:hypothetical protein V8G54_005793 [Vigna mungo]|uniref:Uncharacterized protein n=1 Tax=Vigna mungo TaxID=3915 RepID=A0AAQ3P0E3_VIGMU